MSKTITARRMCETLIEQQAQRDMWGGVAYIHMRTPQFAMAKDKQGDYTVVQPKMRKYHATDLLPVMENGVQVLVKSGPNKGKPKMQGRPNPFWDFENNRPKVIKHTRMQVQVGFDWFRIMQAAQHAAGLTPDYAGGDNLNWRAQTRFIEVEFMKPVKENKKTVFFYKMQFDSLTREPLPFKMGRDRIYLACLRPTRPLPTMQTEVWFEELATGDKLGKAEQKLLMDQSAYKLSEPDEDDVAESQGHPDHPELNREMFTVKIGNIVSLSAFGLKFSMPLNPDWAEGVDPVNFAEVGEIVMDEDESTRPENVIKAVSSLPADYYLPVASLRS